VKETLAKFHDLFCVVLEKEILHGFFLSSIFDLRID